MKDFRVILIDDDEDDALLLSHVILHRPRIRFSHYLNPILFLSDLQTGICQADLIITDFRLPNCSGLDLIKSIHFYCKGHLPKIVLWSGSQITNQELEKCLELQAVFVEKGLESHALIAPFLQEAVQYDTVL